MSSQPIIDPQNPLYCPSVPANIYINQVLLRMRNQRVKSRPHKNILSPGIHKKSPTSHTAPVSSFVSMLAHWLQSKRREELASNSNDCLDFGIPTTIHADRTRANKILAKRRGPRTRAQARMLDPEESARTELKSPTTTSTPMISVKSVSPAFSVASTSDGEDHKVDFFPPGLGHGQERVSTQLRSPKHSSSTINFGVVQPFIPEARSRAAPDTKVTIDRPRSERKAQPSIDKYKSRKRKLEERFPELLKLDFDRDDGAKRHRGTWNTPPLADEESDTSDAGISKFPNLYGRKTMLSPGSKMSNTQEILAEQRIRVLEDALYGQPIGTESPRGYKILLDKLDAMMPGIRLRERLSEDTYSSDLLTLGQPVGDGYPHSSTNSRGKVRERSHQGVADFLGEQGLLNERVMEMLRTSEIQRLEMASTLADEGGLNLGGRDALKVFGKPNSFLFLAEISFSGTYINDADILHLIRLPKLKRLWLEETGIGDEAVYHLTGLRSTLCGLSVASNPRISDDAVPALILLPKLQFLSLIGTGIGMVGLRKLASVVNREKRVIDVEIPEKCEIYVTNLETNARYLLRIQPPLISIPSLCDQLSIGALKRNLEAHLAVAATRVQPVVQSQFRLHGTSAAAITEISDFMTKDEMRGRLSNILRTRETDLLVKGMILG